MNKPLFYGVCTALVTPFLDGKINYPMLKVLLTRQMEAGIRAVVIAGTTGESATLSDEEKIALFQYAKACVGDKMRIIAGTGSNHTQHAISLSVAAQDAGADGLLVVSPYYNKATPEGMIAHYAAIAQAVSVPLIVYNVPSRTGLDIPVGVYRQLSQISNVVGVKEAATDMNKLLHIRQQCPEFALWCGNDNLTVPALSIGGVGVISVISNLFPDEMSRMVHAALSGDFTTAAMLQDQLLPWMDFLSCEVNPIPIKAAMAQIGLDCGTGRLPLTPLSTESQRKLDALKCASDLLTF